MPNICTNQFRITGNPQDITRFTEHCIPYADNIHQFDPELIVPVPEEQSAQDLWGTRWIDCGGVTLEDNQIDIYFQSAWAPPVELSMTMSALYPTLLFKLLFQEEGCDFGGLCVHKNGVELFYGAEDLMNVYDDIEMVYENDQWLVASSNEALPDVTQEDIDESIQYINRFTFSSYQHEEEEAREYTQAYSLIGDNFPSILTDDYLCSICLNTPNNPQISTCDHIFCQGCIATWVDSQIMSNRHPRCPNCRAAL